MRASLGAQRPAEPWFGEASFQRDDGKTFAVRDGVLSAVYPESNSGTDQEWNRIYERLAPFYEVSERVLSRLITGLDIDVGRAEIVSHLGLSPGIRLLEVSPGPGVFQDLLRRRIGPAGEYVALDLSLSMLRQSQQRCGVNAILVLNCSEA